MLAVKKETKESRKSIYFSGFFIPIYAENENKKQGGKGWYEEFMWKRNPHFG